MNFQLNHFSLLIKKIGIAFLIFSLCRILFYVFNSNHFTNVNLDLFFYGIRFDVVAISFLYSPLIILSIVPFSFRNYNWYNNILSICFYTANSLAIIINLLDVAYFDFTFKRTTADFFGMVGTGDDFFNLLPHYIVDFWYDYLLLLGLLILSWFLHKKYCKPNNTVLPYKRKDYLTQSIIFLVFSFFAVIGMRGGFQYRPIGIVNAGQYSKSQNIPIVLNTPFTILKTMFIENIEAISYFSEEEVVAIYTPQKTINSNSPLKGKNVVFIILESFAKEYVGGFNNGKGFTPFLDSLMKKSYIFNNAHAI